MRLKEFAPSGQQKPTDDSEGVLVTVLQFLKNKGDQHGGSIKVPMSSVASMMANAGIPFDYTSLEQLSQRSDTIKNLIKTFNKDEVVINTLSDNPVDGDMNNNGPGNEKTVDSMAKKAAKRRD